MSQDKHRFEAVDLPDRADKSKRTTEERQEIFVAYRDFLLQNPGKWSKWPITESVSSTGKIHARVQEMKLFGTDFEGRTYRGEAYVRYSNGPDQDQGATRPTIEFETTDIPERPGRTNRMSPEKYDLLIAYRAFLIEHPREWSEWPPTEARTTASQINSRVKRMKIFGDQFEGRYYQGKTYVRYIK